MSDGKLATATKERMERVREKMSSEGLDAYIFYSKDPHQSEYIADFWNDRAWLTGFNGSAGTLVVTAKSIGLWTDARYAVAAREQLAGTEIAIHVAGTPGVESIPEFLKETLLDGARVGVNGRVLSLKACRDLERSVGTDGIEIVSDIDVLDGIWTDRPRMPSDPIRLYPAEFAGLSRKEKIGQLREIMRERGIGAYAVCALDAVAWILNIRGSDIDYCPIAYAFALISQDGATLFADASKVSAEVRAELESDGVMLKPYSSFAEELAKTATQDDLGCDPAVLSRELYDALPEKHNLVELKCLVSEMKCIKNAVEIRNLEEVLERDGVAFCRFLFWLEKAFAEGVVTELDAAEKIEYFRRKQIGMVDLSFASISGYGPHAALPHYRVDHKSNSQLRDGNFFLLDSGGQYLGGTTDLTRTVALGELNDEMRRDYTLVLKGLINMSRAVFLSGIKGCNLDVLARAPMWENGIDYKHGTGHGVGSFLNVHEGPCGLSLQSSERLRPGMVLTIEPGIYREGSHGVRLENMVVIEEAMQTDMGSFLKFKTMTLAPIDTRPIMKSLLTEHEIEWLNSYHRKVSERLGQCLNDLEKERLRVLSKRI